MKLGETETKTEIYYTGSVLLEKDTTKRLWIGAQCFSYQLVSGGPIVQFDDKESLIELMKTWNNTFLNERPKIIPESLEIYKVKKVIETTVTKI